jgi:hypothetical protein
LYCTGEESLISEDGEQGVLFGIVSELDGVVWRVHYVEDSSSFFFFGVDRHGMRDFATRFGIPYTNYASTSCSID